MTSLFTDKSLQPTQADLEKALGKNYINWEELFYFTLNTFPESTFGWHYSGQKFGWSFRISDKKRVLLYLLPRDRFFKAAFVFGDRAVEEITSSNVAELIKLELINAKKYAEGRGIRIEVKDISLIEDLKKLIVIKIKN
ncbi:DUF3788 domain-containing protein [Chryseobacterium daecheongense]|uniref:DUF3788 family protein n=1 Tax=Chryseobacterium daecheongense TaxID=192389 RepID=UPI001FD6B9DC|nr:DUF3788 family protein [Chryseobacterium daecheongense]UOU96794.1 DUF3788 domain-containing protein [Chryseobacterium daecheongense]